MSFAFGVVTLGACGEVETDDSAEKAKTVQQPVTDSCEPDEGYDECFTVDVTGVEHWSNTLPDPDWRTVEPVEDEDVDYEVSIDVEKLFGGMLLQIEEQGHYDSWDDYFRTKGELLGVNLDDNIVVVEVDGFTVKLDRNHEPLASVTTGNLIYDALSDESGRVFVDGEDVSNQLASDRTGNEPEVILPNGDTTTTGHALNLSLNIPGDQTILEDGPWWANYSFDIFGPGDVGWFLSSEITGVRQFDFKPVVDFSNSPVVTVEYKNADNLVLHNKMKLAGDTDLFGGTSDILSGNLENRTLADIPLGMDDACSYGYVVFDTNEDRKDEAELYPDFTDENDCDPQSP